MPLQIIGFHRPTSLIPLGSVRGSTGGGRARRRDG